MPIGVSQFPILSFEQANPLLTGIRQGSDIFSKLLENAYAPQMYASDLEHKKLINSISQIEAKYKEPKTLADLEKLDLENKRSSIENEFVAPGLEAKLKKSLLENEFYPERQKAEIGLTNARIPLTNAQTKREQFLADHPLLGLGGLAAQYGAVELLNEKGNTPGSNGANLNEALNVQLRKDRALAERWELGNKAFNFKTMPPKEQQQYYNQARSFGYSNDEIANHANQGASLNQLAQAKGFTSPQEWPEASPLPTAPVITRQQTQHVATEGRNAVEPFMTKAIKPYAFTITNPINNEKYSPEFVKDMLIDNPKTLDRRANYVAANMMGNEEALTLLRQGNIQAGITVLQHTLDALQRDYKIPYVSPELFELASEKFKEQANLLSEVEQKAAKDPNYKYKKDSKKNIPNFSKMSEAELDDYIARFQD
jgi:hypothetical protein